MLRQKTIVLGLAIALLACSGLLYLCRDALFLASIQPGKPFEASRLSTAPDYTQKSGWALIPETPPVGGWETPWGIDVFFIHPTSVTTANGQWNADANDLGSIGTLDDVLLPNHAAAFARAGPVYAPRYRQAVLAAVTSPSADGAKAMELAYQDVLAAFDVYMAERNLHRGIMLVGVEQGGLHAARLLADRFQDSDLREHLAAAYLIDAPLAQEMLEASINLPVCDAPDAIGCVVSWVSRIDGRTLPVNSSSFDANEDGQHMVCVNPLSWKADTSLAPVTDHLGGVRAETLSSEPVATGVGSISARCRDGALEVEFAGGHPYATAPVWGGNFVYLRYAPFFENIAVNASERAVYASFWMGENVRKPARPFPPIQALEDAPIHRPGDVPDAAE